MKNFMVVRCALIFMSTSLCLPVPAAEPAAKWQFAPADSQKWAARIRKFCPKGWTVTARGNDIIVQRDGLVHFTQMPINAPAIEHRVKEKKVVIADEVYRLTLQFAAFLSQDEYDRRVAENDASRREDERLRRKYKVGGKFGQIISVTEDDKKREQAYRAEAAKLTYHRLPDLYSPQHSITLYQSWNWAEYLDSGDEAIDAECNEVEETIVKFFGNYNYLVASDASGIGRQESLKDKPIKE